MPWSPTIDDIEKMSTEKLLDEQESFINLIFSGNQSKTEKSERTKRFAYSFGKDIYHAVSQGRWKLSKHIFI